MLKGYINLDQIYTIYKEVYYAKIKIIKHSYRHGFAKLACLLSYFPRLLVLRLISEFIVTNYIQAKYAPSSLTVVLTKHDAAFKALVQTAARSA